MLYLCYSSLVGIYYDEGPPVPFPNTVVKLIRAENTWRDAAWENRSTPTFKPRTIKYEVFLFLFLKLCYTVIAGDFMQYFEFKYENKFPYFFRTTVYFILNLFVVALLCYLLLIIPIVLSAGNTLLLYFLFSLPIIFGVTFAIYNASKLQGIFLYKDYIEVVGQNFRKLKISYDQINLIRRHGKNHLSNRRELYGYGEQSYLIFYGTFSSFVICLENYDELFATLKNKNPDIKFFL